MPFLSVHRHISKSNNSKHIVIGKRQLEYGYSILTEKFSFWFLKIVDEAFVSLQHKRQYLRLKLDLTWQMFEIQQTLTDLLPSY